ncbi:MAG: hypothetical protein FWG88_11530 [Oscillospiraceae bacterium]|nr:hypothetical protein [Oscillospiraceae bacterium]
MAVEVETKSYLLPLTVDDSSRYVAPHQSLRQTDGRYLTFLLVRCEFINNAFEESRISKK